MTLDHWSDEIILFLNERTEETEESAFQEFVSVCEVSIEAFKAVIKT